MIGLAVAWRAAAARSARDRARARRAPAPARRAWPPGCSRRSARPSLSEEPLLRARAAQRARLPGVRRTSCADAAGRGPAATSRCGTLLVARDGDEAEALTASWRCGRARPAGAAAAAERGAAPGARPGARAPARARRSRRPRDRPARADRSRWPTALRRAGGELRDAAPRSPRSCSTGGRVDGVRLADGDGVVAERGGDRRRACGRAAGAASRTARAWSRAPGQGPDPAPARPRRARAAHARAADEPAATSCPRGDGRYVLGATDGGARLRHDGHRRRRSSSCCATRSSWCRGSPSS